MAADLILTELVHIVLCKSSTLISNLFHINQFKNKELSTLLRFYFREVLEQLHCNKNFKNFHFKRVVFILS